MTNPKRRTLPAVVAGALGIGAAVTAWAEPSQQDQIAALQARIASLENQQVAKTAEANATIDSVMRDADAHSKLLAMTGGAGHSDNGGFVISSGDFTMNISPGVQARFVANYGGERKNGNSDIQTGWEITRARLAISGSAWDPALTYYFQWDMGDINGGTSLLDACVRYQWNDQFASQVGQFKDIFSHEWAMGDFELLGSTRSLTNALIGVPEGTGGRVQGGSLWYGTDKDQLHAAVALHDGLGSGNTSFQDTNQYFGVSGRVEFKFSGDWKDYWDFSARNTKNDLLVIGGGVDGGQGENFTAYKFAVDGQFESNNLSIFAAFNGQYFDLRNDVTVGGNDDGFSWGVVAQAGYAFTRQWEIFGRLDYTRFDNTVPNVDEDTFPSATIGVNYYLGKDGSAGNNAKVTVDLTWLTNGSPLALPYDDVIGGSSDSEIVLRAQMQFRP